MEQNKNEDRLVKIFTNVNDWVKFAESKNLMLITFNAASIFGVAKLYDLTYPTDMEWVKSYLFVPIILLVFSSVVCLISYVPRVKMLKGGEFASKTDSNIWFYETLKNKSGIDIIQQVYDSTETDFSVYEKDLAEQIIQNSKIASKKYSYFTIAVWLTISAYITIVLAGIYLIYNYANNSIEKQ